MLDIEVISKNTTAKSTRLIEVTPDMLRECAARIERCMGSAFPGDSIICELTSSISVVFKPAAKTLLTTTGLIGNNQQEE